MTATPENGSPVRVHMCARGVSGAVMPRHAVCSHMYVNIPAHVL